MKKEIMFRVFLSVFLLLRITAAAQDLNKNQQTKLFNWLNTIPDLEVKIIESDSIFTEAYEIMIIQPLDHKNPEKKIFQQRLFLSHINEEKPVIFDTEGYSAKHRTLELSRLLNANQLIVEHRYFGESVPDSIDWQFMNIKQAASDHHRIVSLFKEFYAGKWISTGISKGGQTAMYHRKFFPDDVDATLTYVAPLNYSDRDERVYEFIDNVSTPECRKKVEEFQNLVLQNKSDLLPLFKSHSDSSNLTYKIGLEAAFEYVVLEYSFAYWQWSDGNCELILTSTSTTEEVFNHLRINSPFKYISDKEIEQLKPFFYQAFTEIGYYDYEIEGFSDLIKNVDGSNKIFLSIEEEIKFDPSVMQDVNDWIQNEGNNFIFIYGEFDPWSATSVELSGKTNSIKIIHPNGSHRTRIKHLSDNNRGLIFTKLEEWLDLKLD
ncbi:S28 family serine protease [Bacteroidota bacterium]